MTKKTLLLVGRSGSGKSSIGNSILGIPAFSEMRGETMLSIEKVCNDDFDVVDCSGIGDTGSDLAGDIEDVIQTASNAVKKITGVIRKEFNGFEIVEQTPTNEDSSQDDGFNVLIFVMKYGGRFTKQEKDTVQMVKSIFGENILKVWGILAFSYGDNFKLDTEDKKTSFEDWCREQTGDIKLLFEEVQHRCVIFDNKSKVKDEQLKNLKENIDKVTKNGRPYTMEHFNGAKIGRVKLFLNYSFRKLQTETDSHIAKVNQVMEQQPPDFGQMKNVMDYLLRHVDQLITEDQDTGVLKPLIEDVKMQIDILRIRIKQTEGGEDTKTWWDYMKNFFLQAGQACIQIFHYLASLRGKNENNDPSETQSVET